MARHKKEESSIIGMEILDESPMELVEVQKQKVDKAPEQWEQKPNYNPSDGKGLINCLRNEVVLVKHIDKQTGLIKDPKHVLYGGMSENAKKTYTVPLLRSGVFCNVLTKDEKDYLEYALGLEPNALSIYKTENNFWSTANPQGISTVTLEKHDNRLDLSKPSDYIKYKILLANKDRIAPSIQELRNAPKATYEFVIVADSDRHKMATTRMTTTKQAYKVFGKIEDNPDIMRLIIETIEGRPVSKNTAIELLQTKIDDIIQSNAGIFLRVADDDYLNVKVVIKKAIDAGLIANRGNYLYIRETNTPMCEDGQEPTMNIAAVWLAHPKRQELKFSLEAKLKQYD